jgi:UDP-N-acetylglucosamine 2-epimerase (non-hydrolysing)
VREGIPYEQVFVTGNTGIDALRFASTLDVAFDDEALAEAVASGDPIVTVTAHRRENWEGGLARIAEAIGGLAAAHPGTRFVVPLHPNPLVREQLGRPLAVHANVVLTEPLSYAPFARLMARSTLIVTDSGGIQEEAPALDVPVLVTRDTTERGEGVEAGTLRLVGTDPDRIVEAASLLLNDPAAHAAIAAAVNPYGDGQASERVVAALEYLAGLGPAPVRFGPGFSRRAVLAAAGYPAGLGTASGIPRGLAPDRDEETDRWVGR